MDDWDDDMEAMMASAEQSAATQASAAEPEDAEEDMDAMMARIEAEAQAKEPKEKVEPESAEEPEKPVKELSWAELKVTRMQPSVDVLRSRRPLERSV